MTSTRLSQSVRHEHWLDSRPFRYGLVIAVSALLHAALWEYRHLLNLRPETLPQPKPPIEVTLTPAAQPVAAPPTVTPTPAPVAQPTPPPAKPKTPPKPPAPPKAEPKPVEPPRPTVPKPTTPSKSHPSPREIEEDPNLPPIKPVEPSVKKPPTKASEPRPAPRPPEPVPSTPSRSPSSAPTPSRPSESSASSSAASAARPAPAAPKADTAGGAYEPAKANAAYLHNPRPEYPALAKRRQWEGKVILKVRVLASGQASQVSVATSSGHDLLDDSAVEAVSHWRFVPAKRGGQAVDSWVNVPINFNLLNDQ